MKTTVKEINLSANYTTYSDDVRVSINYDDTLTLGAVARFDSFDKWVDQVSRFKRFVRKGLSRSDIHMVDVTVFCSEYDEQYQLIKDHTAVYTGLIDTSDNGCLVLKPDFVSKDDDSRNYHVLTDFNQTPINILRDLAQIHDNVYRDKLVYENEQKEKEESIE